MLGVLAFIVTLLVLVLVHEWGHFKAARWFGVAVEEFGFGFPPAIFKRKLGATVYSFNSIPLGGFVRIKGEEQSVNESDSYSMQPAHRRAAIIVAGVAMNMLLTIFLFTVGFTFGLPVDVSNELPSGATVKNMKLQIVNVLPESAASGRLLPGDEIITIDGYSFNTVKEVQSYTLRSEPDEVNVLVKRGGANEEIPIDLSALPNSNSKLYGLGIELYATAYVSYPFYRAPFEAVRMTGDLFGRIMIALIDLVRGFVRGTEVSFDVAGPVGIAVLTSEVAKMGWPFFIQFVALLSLNLAFINILPLPALDGGRLLFIIIEVLRRRPVSEKLERQIHSWGFVALLFLVVIVTYFDLRNFGKFW